MSAKLDLAGLLARVEKAVGPDRALDALLWLGVARPEEIGLDGRTLGSTVAEFPDSLDQIADWWSVPAIPRLTASLDAALALLERVYPDAQAAIYTNWRLTKGQPQNDDGSWTITDQTPRGCFVRFYGGEYMGPMFNASGEAPTPALALLAAMLTALQSSEDPTSAGCEAAVPRIAVRPKGKQ